MEKRNINDLFCDNEAMCNEIITFLTDNLLGEELSKELELRYNDMRSNYDNRYQEWKFTTDSRPFQPEGKDRYSQTTSVVVPIYKPVFKKTLNNSSAIGIDLPTWYNMNSPIKKVMFIAQDPLRDIKWYGGGKGKEYNCSDIILSSPFGTHDAKHRNSRFGRLYFKIFQDLINTGYGIYLTDINKLYVGTKTKELNESKLTEECVKMLHQEIEIIKPDLIVTFGSKSTKFFASEFEWFNEFTDKKFNKLILPMVHPSPAARGTKALTELLNGINKDENLINKYIEKIQEMLTEN